VGCPPAKLLDDRIRKRLLKQATVRSRTIIETSRQCQVNSMR